MRRQAHNSGRHHVKNFQYGYFALIMATGIVSIACHLAGINLAARALFILNNIQYVICLALALGKLVLAPGSVWRDLTHHEKGPGYLTMVAATNVLGVQYVQMTELHLVPLALFWLGCGLYVVLVNTMLTGVTMAKSKPALMQGMNGSWLLCTVSGCSVAILGSSLSAPGVTSKGFFLFCVGIWSIGIMLYLMVIALAFLRWLFVPMDDKSFSPTWWINMGALAISTLAGSHLYAMALPLPQLDVLAPIILGISLFLWSASCWWLVLLLFILVWRIASRAFTPGYSLQNWSAIFPMGMFCVASMSFLPQVGVSSWMPLLQHLFTPVVLALWAWVFVGFLTMLYRQSKA